MKTPSKFVVSLFAAALLCLASTAPAQLVTNGGFETGDFTGWTVSDPGDIFTGVTAGAERSGNFGAFFGTIGSINFLSQNLMTIAGGTYSLTYWLSNLSSNPTSHFEASWNGSIIAASVLDNSAEFDYTQFTFPGLLATGALTEIRFGFRHDPSFFLFDDVSVVPEAFSTFWLGLPVAGLFAFARLRRRQT